MKTLQGFETIEIEADSDSLILRQGEEAVSIPAHMIGQVIKLIHAECPEEWLA